MVKPLNKRKIPVLDPHVRPLSQVITDTLAGLTAERITIGDILEAFHERGFGVLLIILAMPMLPVPPGLNTIFAIPMLILTTQQALGHHTVWAPEFVRRKSLSTAQFKGFLETTLPWVKRLEVLIKPRMGFLTQGVFSHLIGVTGMIMALMACVPAPLTHTMPSFGIALMAVGVMMRDGLAVCAGAVIGLGWVLMLITAVIFLGTEGLDMIKQTIHSFI